MGVLSRPTCLTMMVPVRPVPLLPPVVVVVALFGLTCSDVVIGTCIFNVALIPPRFNNSQRQKKFMKHNRAWIFLFVVLVFLRPAYARI